MKILFQLLLAVTTLCLAPWACQNNYALAPLAVSNTATPTRTPTHTSTPFATYTPTMTATSSCQGEFGNNQSNWVNQYVANYLLVSPFTNSNNAAVTGMMVYSSAVGNARVGIYTAGATLPNALLVQSNTQACVVGWNTFAVATTDLLPGTYWLAVDTDATGVCVSTSPGTKNAEAWTLGSFPANFGSPVGSFPYNMSIVALYYCY